MPKCLAHGKTKLPALPERGTSASGFRCGWAGRQTAIIVRHPNPCIISASKPLIIVSHAELSPTIFRPHSQHKMSLFRVQEHTVTTSHIREYPGGTAGSQDDELKLAVKQYTPLDNQDPKPGDVTIIGGHANGFPKVSRSRGVCIHASDMLILLYRNYTNPFGTSCIKG